MVDLILASDCGTSLIKNIFSFGRTHPELLVMPPGMVCVGKDSIDSYRSRIIANPAPHNSAWISYGGKYYIVGFLAEKEFDAFVNVKQVKYENAMRKILAVVGAIATSLRLDSNFSVAIASLLPRTEWENSKAFEQGLTEALANFEFCDRPLSVNLSHFICRPEGAGLFWARSQRQSVHYREMKVATLMLGYRDVSLEVLDAGLMTGTTKQLGMHWMLERVLSRTAGQDGMTLLETIHNCGKVIRPKKFRHLVKSRDANFRAKEEEQIASAVNTSRREYRDIIYNWLDSVVPNNLDEVIIGGGTAEYFKEELRAYFDYVPISWSAELLQDVRMAFDLPFDGKNLDSRLADVYGLYRCLCHNVLPNSTDINELIAKSLL